MNALLPVAQDAFVSRLLKSFASLYPIADCEALVAEIIMAARQGHTCLPISSEQADQLTTKGLVSSEQHRAPLVVDDNQAYLSRHYRYESAIANALLKAQEHPQTFKQRDLDALLSELFPQATPENQAQQEAVRTACQQGLTLLSGGPGTGKTTTVTKMLIALLTLNPNLQQVMLAAPTGKAASRLNQSIQHQLSQLNLSESVTSRLPTEATTLHRLLGMRLDQVAKFNQQNPLACDLLILDECSMIDLRMFANLFNALPSSCRLILIGDPYQLASVEAGSVFADICQGGKSTDSPLHHQLARLEHSFRFDPNAGIGQLARAVHSADFRLLKHAFAQEKTSLIWHQAESTPPLLPDDYVQQHILPVMQADNAQDALDHFNRSRLLCALRGGTEGLRNLNETVEIALKQNSLALNQAFYQGRPIIIRENHPPTGLYNGDTGIVWPDESGVLMAYFEDLDGQLKSIALSRLPKLETAWAMTIHASQGSEFSHVAIYLPTEPSPLLSNELLYTAITRAKTTLSLYSSEASIKACLHKRISRFSGLERRLKNKQ